MTTLDPRLIEIAAKWLGNANRLATALTGLVHRGKCPFPDDMNEAHCDAMESRGWDCLECVGLFLVAAHRRAVEQARQTEKGGPA